MDPITVVKDYLSNNYSYMEDGHFQVDDHDTNLDSHAVNVLDDVNHADIQDNNYHVVTISKNIPIEGTNFYLPKIVKVQVNKNDNTIMSVLESK